MIPPRPAVIAHDKVLRVQKTAAAYDVADACPCTSRPLDFATLRAGVALRCLSYALGTRREDPAWRHSDKELPFPYYYGF